MTVLWVTSVFNAYTSTFSVKGAPGDIASYMVYTSALIPIFMIMVPLLMPAFLSAKKLNITAYSAVAVLCFSATFSESDSPSTYYKLVICTVNILAQIQLTVLYIEHPKMFPTTFAVTSVGISNLVARSTTILAPLLAEADYPTSLYVMMSLSAVAALCSAFIVRNPDFVVEKNTETQTATTATKELTSGKKDV